MNDNINTDNIKSSSIPMRILNAIGRFFISIGMWFAKLGKKIGNGFKNFGSNFANGPIGVKLSYFIMGFNLFKNKQIGKGLLYLFIQIAFILFIVFIGIQQIADFFSLGSVLGSDGAGGDGFSDAGIGDDSSKMLLYGTFSWIVIIAFIALYLVSISSAIKTQYLVDNGKNIPTFKDDLVSLLNERFHGTMLTVPIIGVSLFTIIPIIYMIFIAFTNFDKAHSNGLFDWVGFDNLFAIFSGSGELGTRFFPVLGWTLTWAFFATVTNYFGGIILALVINKKSIKLKSLWRTLFVITIAVPQFITLLTVKGLLSNSGPINTLLINWGWIESPIKFLTGSTSLARVILVVTNMWIGIPFTMLITTGILLNIPDDLYEAASIDGASVFMLFVKITLPYVLFVTTPYLITQFIGNINNFNVIFLLTGGGPATPSGNIAGTTDLLVTWLYKLTVDNRDYSLASVIGIYVFIICSTLALTTYRNTSSYKQEDAFQ